MPQICLYLHLHQPYRLRSYQIDEIGASDAYFSSDEEDTNKQVFSKVAHKSYYPMLTLLKQLLLKEKQFNFSLSITGVFLEQAQTYEPEVLQLLQDIIATGRCEILSETYHHTLASLYSETEFASQVEQHREILQALFQYKPTVFRNTELVYSNDIARQVAKLGFSGMLTEGVDRILLGRPRTQLYYSVGTEQLPLLLKHAQLSDDIAFRFSDRNWKHFPLSADTYLDWVQVYREDELINLFMDFETFGEHQWADTGIFPFFESFVHMFVQADWNSFVLPSEAIAEGKWQVSVEEKSATQTNLLKATQTFPPENVCYDVPEPISWADVDRDLSAWLENAFQQDCLSQLYALEQAVLISSDSQILNDWRCLQTSDHFYYMCTKWSADGDVHAYFSPYRDPFEAYRRYSVVLADFKHRVRQAALLQHHNVDQNESPVQLDN